MRKTVGGWFRVVSGGYVGGFGMGQVVANRGVRWFWVVFFYMLYAREAKGHKGHSKYIEGAREKPPKTTQTTLHAFASLMAPPPPPRQPVKSLRPRAPRQALAFSRPLPPCDQVGHFLLLPGSVCGYASWALARPPGRGFGLRLGQGAGASLWCRVYGR